MSFSFLPSKTLCIYKKLTIHLTAVHQKLRLTGKSTLMKAMIGLLPDYDGSIRVLENEVFHTDKNLLSKGMVYA